MSLAQAQLLAEQFIPDGALWRANELGSACAAVVPSGWATLDAQLPGGGWPCQAVTEVLCPQPSVLEWRLLAPALRLLVAQGRQIVLVGPPKHPCLPGLLHEGLTQAQLVWIQADAPAQRLWVVEQLIKSNAAAVIMAWLPQARAEQMRRLQINAQACAGLVFLFRPEAAQYEASAAPLRLHVRCATDWQLQICLLKRRGPVHDGVLLVRSVPGGLSSVLTADLLQPS